MPDWACGKDMITISHGQKHFAQHGSAYKGMRGAFTRWYHCPGGSAFKQSGEQQTLHSPPRRVFCKPYVLSTLLSDSSLLQVGKHTQSSTFKNIWASTGSISQVFHHYEGSRVRQQTKNTPAANQQIWNKRMLRNRFAAPSRRIEG